MIQWWCALVECCCSPLSLLPVQTGPVSEKDIEDLVLKLHEIQVRRPVPRTPAHRARETLPCWAEAGWPTEGRGCQAASGGALLEAAPAGQCGSGRGGRGAGARPASPSSGAAARAQHPRLRTIPFRELHAVRPAERGLPLPRV